MNQIKKLFPGGKNNGKKRPRVPIHQGKEVGKKTLRGIINNLDITVEEFIKILREIIFAPSSRGGGEKCSNYFQYRAPIFYEEEFVP